MLSVFLLSTMDSKKPSRFLLGMESVISGLLDIKLGVDVCFFFDTKEKTELCVPASNANAFCLFDDTIELQVYVPQNTACFLMSCNSFCKLKIFVF